MISIHERADVLEPRKKKRFIGNQEGACEPIQTMLETKVRFALALLRDQCNSFSRFLGLHAIRIRQKTPV